MEKRKILIADSSEEFTAALEELLQERCTVQSCSNGSRALELLRDHQPDVLVLDLMLPELDGISLLYAAAEEGLTARVLAVTRFTSPYVEETVSQLGVSYVMVKPCTARAVAGRVLDLANRPQLPQAVQPDLRHTVSDVLVSLRVPTKLRGYGCAREAVLCLMRDPEMSITKELYPAVAQVMDGNPAQVERAIRGAIHAAWVHQDGQVWPEYFRPCADGTIPRPSNAEFLLRIADRVSLGQP